MVKNYDGQRFPIRESSYIVNTKFIRFFAFNEKKNHENTIDNPTIKKGRFVPTISIQRDLYNYANYNEIPLDKKFERSFQLTYRDPS